MMPGSTCEREVSCVARTWSTAQRLHAGDVSWSWSGGDGRMSPNHTWRWASGHGLVGFANGRVDGGRADVELHLPPDVLRDRVDESLDQVMSQLPRGSVTVLDRERHLIAGLVRAGARARSDPEWAILMAGELDHDPPTAAPPDGTRVRPARDDEHEARTALHRVCWAPARIKELMGLAVDGPQPESSYDLTTHQRVVSAPGYRRDLDLVVEAASGELVGYVLGWLDPVSASVLIEPLGVVPGAAGRGIGRAVTRELLRAARAAGADRAVVRPRGDPGYPAPRRLYESLGLREVGREVPYVWDPWSEHAVSAPWRTF